AAWDGGAAWDCVVCTEVLEHAADPRAMVESALRALAPGGCFILTAAGEGRPVHHNWSEDEPYLNVTEAALRDYLQGFERVAISHNPVFKDIYAVAMKPAAASVAAEPAREAARRSLRDIGIAFGTDKVVPLGYDRTYARMFGPLRDAPLNLLEVGV